MTLSTRMATFSELLTASGSNSFSPIIPYGNGFVQGVYRAFQQDLHLVIRPDDVWLAIITQFSQFVKGNSGALRDHFVDHKGQKALEIDVRPASIWSVTMGQLAYAMTSLMQQNLRDPELRDWILPAFSTTTEHDTSVASMVVMAALQNYFSFNLSGGCGFPSVTLEGEKADWEKILSRVKQLPKYGEQTMEWTVLLVPILKKFISSFDPLDSYEKEQLNEFWLRACHATGQDSSGDVETLSGWLTAFCFWDEKGYRISNHADTVNGADRNRLVLNNIAYPIIRTMNIPDYATMKKHSTTIVVGSMGMTLSNKNTTVQPRSGWFLLENTVEPFSG
ncbi:hypothetical protein EJ08DRAFT_673273 [Tothia fuscella]|uniref:DUF4419 domain-containing protein n=1 Tax=Tothia fuscella TaxID=1048955 RepID=A0A9P4NFZ7_9PEZI|nr:hypothetical protein EJ08DRAFT_673273 [Tothia fuscella]